MSRYGLRVFELTLYRQTGRKSQPWNADGWHFVDLGERAALTLSNDKHLLDAHVPQTTLRSWTAITPVSKVLPRAPYSRWMDTQRVGDRLSLQLKFGVGADYSESMSPSGDSSLKDQAAARTYRAEAVFPPGDGEALLAVEVVNRACPVNAIICWLNAALYFDAGAEEWWRVGAKQVTDSGYLVDLIRQAKDAQITLKKVGIDGEGDQTSTQYRLEAPLRWGDKRLRAVDWVKQETRDLQGMLSILDIQDAGDLQFNQGHIALDDGESKTKIGLSDARETFTYPLGSMELDTAEWEKAVAARLQTLKPELPWPSP